VRTLFFDNSLIALHSFPFTQKINDHSSLLSVRSFHESDVPSSGNGKVKNGEGRNGKGRNREGINGKGRMGRGNKGRREMGRVEMGRGEIGR
jgi:hypothetical protein